MRTYNFKAILKAALRVACILPFAAVVAFGQQQVNLTAGPTSITLPDGSTVPMWGYSCGTAVTGSTATCVALNKAAVGTWSPVVITIPTGQDLTINLTNNLSFTPSGSTTANTVPTSLVIVGQLGGGLGTTATSTLSPDHSSAQANVTWPIAGAAGNPGTPPAQGPRVQSFSTEVAFGATTALIWKAPRPGTYLIESGTHPSIQGSMGLYGMLVVTTAPTVSTTGAETAAGAAYPGVSYDADVPLLLSEIDPVQNNAVNAAVNTVNFTETAVWSGQPGGCGNPSSATFNTCYPPAVNYTPLYYLFNGVAFNKTNASASLFPLTPAMLTPTAGAGTGSVLVRFVNAGLRMHVPSIVGSLTGQPAPVVGFSLIAEDGNPLPGLPRVQSEVFMAAGKSYDVLINGPAGGVSAVKIASAGAGYTSSVSEINYTSGALTGCTNPTVSINSVDGNGTGATASLMVDSTGTIISQINLLTAGAGYTSAPLVSVTDSAVSPAASCTSTTIATTLTPLPVNFSGGGGTGASATATITGGAIAAITVLRPGNGYTSDPAVSINATPTTAASLTAVVKPGIGTFPVYDRELSLSGNAIARDAGMLAYIGIDGGTAPASPALGPAVARADTYNSVIPGQTLTVSDPAKGVIANDTNVYDVKVQGTGPAQGTLTLNADGTFTYVASSTWATSDAFTYCGNGATSGTACTTVTLGPAPIEAQSGILMNPITYTSNVATSLSIKSPGVLSVDKDLAGYPLSVVTSTAPISVVGPGTLTLSMDSHGGFNASVMTAGTYTFTYNAQNSQGTVSASAATVTLIFPTPSNLQVKVVDGKDKTTAITDYRWIIEEDRTFYIDPACTTNPPPAGCPTFGSSGQVPTFGTNFHTSFMPVVATGCVGPAGTAVACEAGQTVFDPTTGMHVNAVCDVGDGVCRTSATQETPVDPSQLHLDPTKRYYISVLPGDAAIPFQTGNANPGHGMGGAPIAAGQTAVTVLAQPTPFPPAKLTVFVFEDDWPLNGEQDGGGGIDVLSPHEPGLGSFNITIMDDAGGPGDPTGQVNYDMFNQPLSNSLAGTIDPSTGMDACPISTISRIGTNDPNQTGITGTIVTCPKYESDGQTLSLLAGQAVVANMMPGRYGIIATPSADRIARGEEWLQTNTLDGQKAHDSFLRIGEPSFFQEFGPAGWHVVIGFANPAIINARKTGVCAGTDPFLPGQTNCTNSVTGKVTTVRMSRTPDERLYSSGTRDSFAFTQCYVSFGDPDGEDFAFTKCDADGNFTLSGLPDGDWRLTTFDQWNDQLVDGLSTPVRLGGGATVNMGDVAANQWQANFYTRTFLDTNGDGVSQGTEPGLALVKTNVRFRDGSFSNRNNTDLNGFAGFNEEFPLFSWYVIETDVTRYKNTGTHVVYDTGGPVDGSPSCGNGTNFPLCDPTAVISKNLANTIENVPLPTNLRVPGAVYCDKADCTGLSIATGPEGGRSSGPGGSTGRIDPPWVLTEGWQGFAGQNSFLEFGKTPYVPGENGGIRGHVIYSSTRPFDDPQFGTQNVWEPLVPGVTINLYQEGTAPDGTTSLTLVDTTKTSSFDDWAQGFRSDGIPNMNCPGQLPAPTATTPGDFFFFSLFNQPIYLDWYNSQHGGPAPTAPPNNSQFKCYDGMHNWNQVQPAPYDGMYQFPSVKGIDPTTGKPTGTNCTTCVLNPDTSDPYRSGTRMLPKGKYVVEVVVPPGYELVKEEDKNILIGDNFIAPVTVQFPGLGSAIYIIPDQAAVGSTYNANSAQNPTQSLGRASTLVSHEGDTATMSTFWPCVGEARIVPDYISLFPQSHEVAPFAGASRNLCDRKEVTLDDQTSSQAEFFIFTSTHAAAHFTGVITDDFTSEFDPFSPQFGEKFAPPDLPVSIKDWTGNEISRVYADHWGAYNGLTYSTWEVNPPNPTGYSPTMMITCMNDPGTGTTPDPLFNPSYSQFCYEIPFMPGATQYMDTPVTPTSAFAGAGYNNVDCAYPDATPAIAEVDGDGIGPYIAGPGNGHPITITALGNQLVNNNAYSGPSATTAPYNQKTIPRHYGFGTQCTSPTAGSTTCNTLSSVTIGGLSANIQSWSDSTIVVAAVPGNVSQCAIQQQAQYGGPLTVNGVVIVPTAKCGEIIVTAGNGRQSIDTVTVTIGGKAPTYVSGTAPLTQSGPGAIQQAIDAAAPGDLIIVPPGVYNEMLLMWKPVRLQGVGAASSIINANTHPAGKMDPWRRQVACLFGIAINGGAYTAVGGKNPFDSTGNFSCPGTGWKNFTASPNNPQVDREPLEATVGWDAALNGNLAEMLQEPTLMGALEGAGITVLAKGVDLHGQDPFVQSLLGGFPDGTTLLSSTTCTDSTGANPFPSSFWCNPSRIDGLGITDSSQGGGGIFVHAWGHNLEIANNRVYNNSGTLSGGIEVGQGEHPPAYLAGVAVGNAPGLTPPPGSCQSNSIANVQLPYCFDMNVNVHHNAVSLNSSTGDELFSVTPAGAGGVSFCSGADFYKFNHNWVCGNLSTGDGGGLGQLGFIYNGDIEKNTVLFNQSTNPTIAANGGGILIMGAPDADPACAALTDADCVNIVNGVLVPNPPSDGVGPNLVINANLIMGNAAESGSGGGIRFQSVNGSDVVAFPTTPAQWYSVSVTNNIITNNVAGWDGAGISLQDALAVNIINNTITSNDTTASSGVLFNTLGAPLASSQGSNCIQSGGITRSCPQPAGLVSIQNSIELTTAMPNPITCPANHYAGTTASNGTCRSTSYPLLANDVFWQNRAFYIGVGSLGTGTVNQQNVVALYNAFTTTPAPSQSSTGACTAASYWDIGVRGDTGPSNHGSTVTLAPTYSVLTDAADYPGLNNLGGNPTFVSQYCNGSRVPPELGSMGYQVPPGISDATVPNPIFNLTPAATVDEGNNWINIAWGPLSMTNPTITNAPPLGNYAPAAGSPAIDYIPSTSPTYAMAPSTDIFGNPRPDPAVPTRFDVGAVEFQGNGGPPRVSPTSLSFGNVSVGVTSASQTVTLSSTGTAVTGINLAFSPSVFSRSTTSPGNCGTTLAANSTCTINVVFRPTAIGAVTGGTLTVTADVLVIGSPVSLSGAGVPAPNASVTAGPYNFGNNRIIVLATHNFTLSNAAGAGTLSNIVVTVSGTSFTRNSLFVPNNCGTTLVGGANCTIQVLFFTLTKGVYTGTVAITGTDSSGNPFTVTNAPVQLSGTAYQIVATPSSITNFNYTTTANRTKTVTVQNWGTTAITLSSATFTGANPTNFSRSGGTCGTSLGAALIPGLFPTSCTINVLFTAPLPTGVTFHATLNVNDNDSVHPQQVTLIGTR